VAPPLQHCRHSREGGPNPCCHPRESGDPGFEWYRAPCARSQQLIAVPRTAGGFLSLLVQSKETKESTPRSARRFTKRSGPLRSSPHRALANSPGAHYAPRAQTRARLTTPGGAAVLGARYGVWSNTLPCLNFTQPALRGISDRLILHSHADF
jgi:hypothetical protein